MRQKLTLITLGVEDFQKSLDFYEKGLGWQKSSASMDGLALFSLGGIILSLHPRHELAEDSTVPDNGSGFRGITLSFNAIDENEVNEVMKQAEAAGAKIIKPAQKVYWGGYSGYFADPDGHLIEVAHNPFWPLDADGNVILPG